METNNNTLNKIFNFSERRIKDGILRDNLREFKTSFNYVSDKLKNNEFTDTLDLSELEWLDGKNYKWLKITKGKTVLLIRKYSLHYTIYCKWIGEYKVRESDTEDYVEHFYTKFGCFSFYSDTDELGDELSDELSDNNFIDINEHIGKLLDFITEQNIHSLWNDYSYERKKHIVIKNIYDGGDSHLSNVDDFLFACDELFQKHLELFSENDMLEKIKTFQVGDVLKDEYKIEKIYTELKDGYYHGVGLELSRIKFKEKRFNDVYALTRWYFDYIF